MKKAYVLACDDNFIPFTTIVAARIVRLSGKENPVIVVSDGVTQENKSVARGFCPNITFFEASSFFSGRNLPTGGSITRASYLRLFLDEILADFDRVAYLDSDLSLSTDLSPLLDIQLRDSPIAAAHDFPAAIEGSYRERLGINAPYFNGCVVVFDLKSVRSEGIMSDALEFALANPDRCKMHDQDALNAVLDGRWQVLDWRWNALTQMIDYMPGQPYIRHLTKYKPWAKKKVGIEKRFVDEWRTDLLESPWPERFHEQSVKYPIRQALRQTGSRVMDMVTGRKAERDRRLARLTECLKKIENQAAEGARAQTLDLP